MAPRQDAQDIYGTYGAVPENLPQGGGGTPSEVHVDAGTMSAPFFAAADTLEKYQGMQNETAMVNGETQAIKNNAALRANFTSLSGEQATAALPKYLNSLQDNINTIRESLPYGARRGFDNLAAHQMANYTSEALSYTQQQVKEATKAARQKSNDAWADSVTDPTMAQNQNHMDMALSAGPHNNELMLDENHEGLNKSEDGTISFADNDAGKQLKAQLDYDNANYRGKVINNAVNAVTEQDPVNGYKLYNQYKDSLSPLWQANIEANIMPKVNAAKVQYTVNQNVNDLEQGYVKFLTNPKALGDNNNHGGFAHDSTSPQSTGGGVNANNIGNVKTAHGASNNIQEFEQPATVQDGANLLYNTLKKSYNGMTIAAAGQKYAPNQPQWIDNATKYSGLSRDTVINTNDPQQMAALMFGINAAEKGADNARANQDIINKTVQSGGTAQSEQQPQQTANYAQHPNGAIFTRSEYIAMNWPNLEQQARQRAEQEYPDDAVNQQLSYQNTINRFKAIAAQDKERITAAQNIVVQGISGALSDGKAPQTYEELYSIPGMKEAMNILSSQGGKEGMDFYHKIPSLIAQQGKQSPDHSQNYNDKVMEVLAGGYGKDSDQEYPMQIKNEGQLHSLLSRNDETGINVKDYNDLKKLLALSATWKTNLHETMQQIRQANIGNGGDEKAMQFLNDALAAKDKAGNEADDLILPTKSGDKYTSPLDDISAKYLPTPQQEAMNMINADRVKQINNATWLTPEGQIIPHGTQEQPHTMNEFKANNANALMVQYKNETDPARRKDIYDNGLKLGYW